MADVRRAIVASFIVDNDPIFAYTGWILCHSLALSAQFDWRDIHVQFTPEVDERIVDMFRALGCATHRIERFGDGKYCNKLAQWDALRNVDADHIVLLDTDMICLGDFTPAMPAGKIGGKVVDLDNPPVEVLDELFKSMGFASRPELVRVDASSAMTYRANCNGGFYSIPKRFAEAMFSSWRNFAELLLADLEILNRAGKQAHVDQIAFCMAIENTALPFEHLPSNLNYYTHFRGEHAWLDRSRPIGMLHYHNSSLDVLGLIEAPHSDADGRKALEVANSLIRACFNTELFWELRYSRFPERGSGIGSRGSNLAYKRDLLRREGIEQADSVLDVGCGDLEVLRAFEIDNYVGLDRSEASLATASSVRPDWIFVKAPAPNVAPSDMVLCFEVAIHQEKAGDYHDLISFLADKTRRTLFISGYDEPTDEIAANHMVYFYEPLKESLANTKKFASIRKIGEHSTVVIYRCDVE
jgi:hypothetical protein